MRGHQGSIFPLNFSPDGKYLATRGADGKVLLWSLSGQQITELRRQLRSDVHSVYFIAHPEIKQELYICQDPLKKSP